MRSKYRNVETVVVGVVSDEEMGLSKPMTFSDLLFAAVKQAERLPKGKGVMVSKEIPTGTFTGTWSTLKRDHRINGECSYRFHNGNIYIYPNK